MSLQKQKTFTPFGNQGWLLPSQVWFTGVVLLGHILKNE